MNPRWIFLPVAMLALMGCYDDTVTEPANIIPVFAAEGLSSPWVPGCSEIHVQIESSGGQDSVAVAIDDLGCGPLHAVIDTAAQKTDHPDVVRLPIPIHDADSWQLEDVAMVSWPDSLMLIAPTNLHGTPLLWSNPDSVVDESADELPGAMAWTYGEGTAEPGGGQIFARRWIEIAIDRRVAEFRARVWFRGRPVPGVIPSQPPGYIPDDVRRNFDTSWRVPIDIITLQFQPNTDLADRQSAIAEVAGEVVGGIPAGVEGIPLEGYYLIRIPSTGVTASLLPAIDSLHTMPQVMSAFMYHEVVTTGRSPSDGPGWTQWHWLPDGADPLPLRGHSR